MKLRVLTVHLSHGPVTWTCVLQGGADAPPEVMRLREQLIQNFQERMQLQRSVIELQSQNVQNTAEINRRCVCGRCNVQCQQ